MTDPKPDPLFDALREQLDDYGQEPPAHLWAGIRQQLPAPVAVPQRRRRWAWSAALLALLVAVIGGVSWQAWELSPLRQRPVAGRTSPRPAAATAASDATTPVAATAAAAAPEAAASTTPAPAGAAAPAAAAAAQSAAAAAATTAAAPATAVAAAPAVAVMPAEEAPIAPTAGTTTAAPSSLGAPAATPPAHAGLTRPTRPMRAAGRPDRAGLATTAIHSAEPAGARARATTPAAAPASTPTTLTPITTAAVARSSTRATTSRAAGAAAASSSFVTTRAAASKAAAVVARQSRATAHLPTTRPGKAPAHNEQAPATSVATPGTSLAPATALPGPTAPEPAGAMAYDQLALRLPSLPAPLPAPQPASPAQPVKRSMAAVPPPARWATQTLFGPALTGVRLGTPSKGAGAVPYSYVTMVTDEEQSARSGSFQFGLRRRLGAHWSLSAGLGVAEYATESSLSQRYFPNITSNLDPIAVRRDSFVVVSKYRKAYQFVTLPVRLGYAWQPGLRWQLGLLAGVDATYLFHATEIERVPLMTGTFASTSAANRQWGLGSSLGLEARYHISPRCELLAQPTFTYLLTPLNRERAGEAPRHPWGAALLLGVAYELR